MNAKLHIAPKLDLPADAVVHTFALLAMRGAGKSNAAVVMAEQMYDAGLHWVAIDPKGDWWGLRSARGGKEPGLPITIFGGQHGDIPLEPDAGAYIADLVVDQTLTCILDLSEFTEGEKIRFLAGVAQKDGFAARLYKRKQPTQAPTHIFLEEADDYLPQRYGKEKAKLMHDCSRLLLWGRQRGIGGTAISQRSARINKDILTQTDNLIVLRTAAPQDQKAILDWVRSNGVSEELIKSLPGLDNGEAWIWSPHWLKKVERVQFYQRRTFDSGSTPALSGPTRKPATLADVDVAAVREKMAASIEKAKAQDPVELQKRIRELEGKLTKHATPASAPAAAPDPKAILAAEERGYSRGLQEARAETNAIADTWRKCGELLDRVNQEMGGAFVSTVSKRNLAADRKVARAVPTSPTPARSQRPDPPARNGNLGKGELAVLIAAAQFEGGVKRKQLTVLTGYKKSSRDSYIQRLSQAGHIEVLADTIHATAAGRAALGSDYERLPTGSALREHWLATLPDGERAILQILVEVQGRPVHRDALSDRTGYKKSSRDSYIQRLSARQLVVTLPGGLVKASEELYY